jgi:hypothetical protein
VLGIASIKVDHSFEQSAGYRTSLLQPTRRCLLLACLEVVVHCGRSQACLQCLWVPQRILNVDSILSPLHRSVATICRLKVKARVGGLPDDANSHDRNGHSGMKIEQMDTGAGGG